MREMKDSGIPWIGEIPSDWKILRLKQLLANGKDAIKVGPFGSQLSGSDFTNDGFWVYNQQTVINHDFSKNDTFINHEKFNAMKSFQVRASDILITTRGTIGKICRIPKNFHEGIIHPCIIKFRIDDTKILYNIIEMLFNNSDLVKNQLNYMSNATTIDVIYSSTLKNIYIPVAPIKVQRRIANYLDAKCAEIDSIRKNVEAEIEALKQYKKSVITEAVTKGLNKDVEMKDSGIPWIGNIPKKWQIVPLKRLVLMPIKDGTHQTPTYTESSNGIPFLSSGNVRTGKINWENIKYITPELHEKLSKEVKPQINDILLAKNGTTGVAAIVDKNYIFDVYVTLAVIRANPQYLIPRFLLYAINSNISKYQFNQSLKGIGTPNLHLDEINKTRILVPTLAEQCQIADFLDSKCSKIDSIIQKKQELLANLDTYKKSLIYEYVTGKKEVPAV